MHLLRINMWRSNVLPVGRAATGKRWGMHETYHDEDGIERCDDCEEPLEECFCACFDCGNQLEECACNPE